MPQIEYPICHVFVGRRRELIGETAKRLLRINYDLRHALEVHTLDWFISSARRVENLVKSNNGGNWPLKMKAVNHRNLAKGLPADAIEFFKGFERGGDFEEMKQLHRKERGWLYDDDGGRDGQDFI